MTKRKTLLSFVLAISFVLPAVFLFTACNHNHKFSDKWSMSATEHWHECTNKFCNEVKDKGEHIRSTDWVVTKQPTCTEAGEKQILCTVCGYTFESQVIPATGHEYEEPTYVWSEYYTKCVAKRTCLHDGSHIEEAPDKIEKTVLQKLTCTQDEYSNVLAIFNKEGFVDQMVQNVKTAEKLGHDYEIVYTWNDDYSKCSAVATCIRDDDEITGEATITSEVTQPLDCEQDEITTYTATFENDVFKTQTKEKVTAEKTGHDYDEPIYEWNEDYSSCVAKLICKNNNHHVISEQGVVTSVVTSEPDCDHPQYSTVTATFEGTEYGFETQVVTEVPTAPNIGHNFGEPVYTWSDDFTTCTATRVCLTDSSHVETETVTAVRTVVQEASLDGDELSTFVADFSNTAFKRQKQENVKTGDRLSASQG